MDQWTTLTTFLLQTSSTVRSVELLGSWDNFRTRYPMEKDLRRGRGSWRGCHSFADISCEGPSHAVTSRRDGGLKMGAKYWYYYLLDGDLEFYSAVEPSTTRCPLLPGQPVNVLDVPIELGPEQARDRSQSAADVYCAEPAARTMDPADKFLKPRRAPTPCPPRLGSAPATLLRLVNLSPRALSSSSAWPFRCARNRPMSSSSARPGLLSSSSRQRSEELPSKSDLSNNNARSGRAISGALSTEPKAEVIDVASTPKTTRQCLPAASLSEVCDTPNTHSDESVGLHGSREPKGRSLCLSDLLALPTVSEPANCLPQKKSLAARRIERQNPTHPSRTLPILAPGRSEPFIPGLEHTRLAASLLVPSQRRSDRVLIPTSSPYCTPGIDEPVTSHFSIYSTPTSARSTTSRFSFDLEPISSPDSIVNCSSDSSTSNHTFDVTSLPATDHDRQPSSESHTEKQVPARLPESSASPCVLQDSFQALSIKDDWFDSTASSLKHSGFQRYCLPEDEHASDATIRKLTSPGIIPSAPSTRSGHLRGGVLLQGWEETPVEQGTSIIDELGYLGDFISRN